MSISVSPKSRASKILSVVLMYVLVLTNLPVYGRAQTVTNPVANDDEKGQQRKEMPYKDLPSLADLQDEGKGLKKTKAKDTPLQPPTLCRFRDVLCLENQKKNGGQISTKLSSADKPVTPQIASAPPKNTGNWFQRAGRKVASAFSGMSALTNPSSAGNSFLPAAPAPAAALVTLPTFATLNEAKLDPHNRIGTGSEDLFSGNIHWSTPLVSLPGRNGLDLNLTLHYNALQWVKYGTTMYFDPDSDTTLPTGLTTGFNLGFPEIESGYTYDGLPAWVVHLPSGYRVPLRRVYQLSSTTKFEAVDGSALYLVVSNSAPVLYTPDGTQYTYGATSVYTSGKRCSQVKDRNGNYLSIAYNAAFISTITDTLGRVLNFSYTSNHLMQITQTWQGQAQPHVLAQFDYGTTTLNYNFPGYSIAAPASGSQLSVLTRVITSDGARHVFVYNGWGIAEDFFLYGEADNQRAYLDYGFPAPGPLSDCPRFGQRDDAIFGWAGQVYNATTGFGRVSTYFNLQGENGYAQVRAPDGVVQKELFDTSGGTRGLATGMETWVGMPTNAWSGGLKKKWTATTWQSDSATMPRYPRVTETNIYDDDNGDNTPENRRRATVSYTKFEKLQAQSTMPYTVYLPTETKEYAADATTVYRSAQTSYLDYIDYWTRWIVGLPSSQRLYDGGGVLQAQTELNYDWTAPVPHSSQAVQHNFASYGANFYLRGNLTTAWRYSVVNGVAGSYTETSTDYYLTGNVAKVRDALGRETSFFYDDSFATYADDASNTETSYTPATKTYAYPTQIQDPALNSSSLKYWYDTGAPTKTIDPKGAAAISIYEPVHGRLLKSKSLVNNAYTRYVYAVDHNSAQALTTVNSLTEETSTISVFDGIGRTRVSVADHPGSAGGLRGSYQVYDILGRVSEWSNPTEIYGGANCGQAGQTACWLPYGDDASGYKISTQTFDWKSRPLVTTNQDFSTRQIAYTGCGCAGGQVTTLTDEMQRQQKVYADFLGRTFKTELWNGASVYSTKTSAFNVRDQVTQVQELANSSGATQNTTLTYDGYGRLATSRKPIETADNTYLYFADDKIQTKTDARGASTSYGYNNRGLLASVSYTIGGSGAAATDGATFQYNELGQRTVMDDGPGIVNYAYNTLGQMTSETRTFDTAGAPTTPFTITYGNYNLAGQVRNIKDPFNDEVNYSYDNTGRLASIIGGTTFASMANYPYLSSVSYRAFNAIKEGRTYDTRMRVSSYSGFGGISYQYDNASQLTTATMAGSEPYTQSFSYDPAGRLTGVTTPDIPAPSQYVTTGTNPPNGLPSGFNIKPFNASVGYDEFGNMTSRSSQYWSGFTASGNPSQTFATTYENGRAKKDGVAGRTATNGTNQTWAYNNSGEIVNDGGTTQQYDVAGQLTRTQNIVDPNTYSNHTHDGDGRQIKFEQKLANVYYSGGYEVVTRYRIYSTVTGKMLTEIDAAGQKMETHVYSIGGQEYRQMKAYSIKTSLTTANNFAEQIVSEYSDPKGTRARQWDREKNTTKDVHMSPVGVANLAIDWAQLKDTFVNNIAAQISFAQSQSRYPGTRSQLEDPTNPGTGCELDGKSVSCGKLLRQARNGGIDEDSVKFYGDSPLNGPGYGGGRTLHDDGEGNIEQVSNVIEGDLNGELIVDRQGGPREPTQTQKPVEVITCTVSLGARVIPSTIVSGSSDASIPNSGPASGFYHAFIVVKQSNESTGNVYHAFSVEGKLSGRVNKWDNSDTTGDFKLGQRSDALKVEAELNVPCDDIKSNFDKTLQAINAKQLDYKNFAFGGGSNNSNAFAYTLLTAWSPAIKSTLETRAYKKGFDLSGKTPSWGYFLPYR